VSLAKLALRTRASAKKMMTSLRRIRATMVRTTTGQRGRRPTVLLAPELSRQQVRAVHVFALARWMPTLSSCSPRRGADAEDQDAA